jgi:hypothetical protein
MSLFFDVLSAINNPQQQANIAQLEAVTNTVQQLASNHGVDANQMQSVLGAVGGALQPALKQHSGGGLDSLISEAIGSGGGAAALQSLITPHLQNQMISSIAQNTGLPAGTLQTLIPALIPVVLRLLNMGKSQTSTGQMASNPLLTAFLGDANQDGSTDLGDVLKFAGRFLNPA